MELKLSCSGNTFRGTLTTWVCGGGSVRLSWASRGAFPRSTASNKGNRHLNISVFFKRVPVNEIERLLVQMKAHDVC